MDPNGLGKVCEVCGHVHTKVEQIIAPVGKNKGHLVEVVSCTICKHGAYQYQAHGRRLN